MEDNITEKFALLNLIKALQGISAPDSPPTDGTAEEITPPPAPAPAEKYEAFNAMASVLERHEALSNRVKNKNNPAS